MMARPQSRTRTWKFRARQWWHACLDELFPDEHPYCHLCRRPLPATSNASAGQRPDWMGELKSICPFCLQEAKQVSLANDVRRIQLNHENPFTTQPFHHLPIMCALTYDGFVRTSIRHWKYDGLIELTPWFSRAMAAVYRVRDLQEYTDVLIGVPTSADRKKKRGYDQGELLTCAIERTVGIPRSLALIRRPDETGFTQSQTAKAAHERKQSLQGKYRCVSPNQIAGKRILLVDDVVTTGATMQVCADLLLNAGAKSVVGLVIANVR